MKTNANSKDKIGITSRMPSKMPVLSSAASKIESIINLPTHACNAGKIAAISVKRMLIRKLVLLAFQTKINACGVFLNADQNSLTSEIIFLLIDDLFFLGGLFDSKLYSPILPKHAVVMSKF